jgi:mRNA-decapping enzyme subunit 2
MVPTCRSADLETKQTSSWKVLSNIAVHWVSIFSILSLTSDCFYSPLKAFINANKPRPPRKGGRHKKGQKNPQIGTHCSDTDPVHESDSQTSDNQMEKDANRPRTPPFANAILQSENIDPHFARLLSSLTLSASSNPIAPTNETQPVVDPATPVPSTLHRNLDPEPQISGDHTNLKPRQRRSITSPSGSSQRDLSSTPVAAPHQVLPTSPSHGRNNQNDTLHSPPAAQASDTSALLRSPHAHRPRTDISPYLTKTTTDTTSTRRLQQLALLEKVADESARMAPQSLVAGPVSVPPPPMSVPPGASAGPGIYYNSHSSLSPGPRPHSTNHENIDYPDFNTRAKGRQAYHRGFTQTQGNLSMNQSQLLALMNNAAPVAPRPHSFQQPLGFPPEQFHPLPPLYGPPPFPPNSNITNFSPYAGPAGPRNIAATDFPFPNPNRFASATPAVDSFPLRMAPTNTAHTLLSILNGRPPLPGNPAGPTSVHQQI